MKILCQQTFSDSQVTGWSDEFDSASWNQVPNIVVNAICVQGMIFTGYDHVAIIHRADGGCEVTEWKDDNSIARTTILLPYAPDPVLNGAINTRISKVVYCEPGLLAKLRSQAPSERTTLLPIAGFRSPPGAKVINGIWQTDAYHKALFDAHQAENKGWRDWGEEGLGDGRAVPLQRLLGRYRRSGGTQTFFKTNNARTNTLDGATDELASESTADTGTVTEAVSAGADEVIMVWTSPVGSPGVAWPTDVAGQLDINSIGGDIDVGFRTAGGAAGHIARIVTGLGSHVETKEMAETLFNSTGIKSYTVSGAWTAGNDTDDRLEALLAATRAASMGGQSVKINTAADSFTDGAWAGAAPTDDIDHPYDFDDVLLTGAAVDLRKIPVVLDVPFQLDQPPPPPPDESHEWIPAPFPPIQRPRLPIAGMPRDVSPLETVAPPPADTSHEWIPPAFPPIVRPILPVAAHPRDFSPLETVAPPVADVTIEWLHHIRLAPIPPREVSVAAMQVALFDDPAIAEPVVPPGPSGLARVKRVIDGGIWP